MTQEPWLCVVAPTSMLMIEIERPEDIAADIAADITADGTARGADDRAEIHVHRGGQGLWVATMARALDARVSVCGPFGGETGDILQQIARDDGMEVIAVDYAEGSAALVHDRRSGEREEIARMPAAPLRRHETDELFGAALVTGTEADVCVLTGAQPADVLAAEFFGRLTHDLLVGGVTVVADLSGEAALRVIEQGPAVLKMAHDEVIAAGLAEEDTVSALRVAGQRLVEQGVGTVVVSRADQPALVVHDASAWLVHTPSLSSVDHRGAGDSMTAGIAVGLARGLSVLEAVRLGAAAGTLNITRRGLGTGRREQIERFSDQVQIEELD
ncbi:PfkB family carbohydrate kinase [Ornithinimicrobium faecis]|uniref:PfkB family carbohydrate kinase n=1 Tax=Ornithinimicrobium faecis TaxID=2934158 RepID=A0ABY4YVJ8_9MICO|nr:PfkB family carbohydrate kinase [Ornithinimicrobium sp. HY1793]USQ80187.1 PfkB family carbohydrate kinase [Ornithinimicrobium sp. HY1793]